MGEIQRIQYVMISDDKKQRIQARPEPVTSVVKALPDYWEWTVTDKKMIVCLLFFVLLAVL